MKVNVHMYYTQLVILVMVIVCTVLETCPKDFPLFAELLTFHSPSVPKTMPGAGGCYGVVSI